FYYQFTVTTAVAQENYCMRTLLDKVFMPKFSAALASLMSSKRILHFSFLLKSFPETQQTPMPQAAINHLLFSRKQIGRKNQVAFNAVAEKITRTEYVTLITVKYSVIYAATAATGSHDCAKGGI
ncbi:MAG TPA: hypothetical protein VEF91_03780, partial [Verrucomicrobiae bacterium]|nr:hypothetical protein [Verrucomicrobiae bacterium]